MAMAVDARVSERWPPGVSLDPDVPKRQGVVRWGELSREMVGRYNTVPIELMKMILVGNPGGK